MDTVTRGERDTVVFVSNDRETAEAAGEALSDEGLNSIWARSLGDALKRVREETIECVVVTEFGDLDPVDFQNCLREQGFDGPVIATGEAGYGSLGVEAAPPGDFEVMADLVSRAVARHRITREMEDHQRLKSLGQELISAVLEAGSRSDAEEAIYETVMAADDYVFAWLVSHDPTTGARAPSVPVSLDVDLGALGSLLGQDGDLGELNRAIDDNEFVVSRRLGDGELSSAVIPLSADETVHGALVVYSRRENAFDETECATLRRVGRTVGQVFGVRERADVAIDAFVDSFGRMLESQVDTAQAHVSNAADESSADYYLDRTSAVLECLDWLASAGEVLAGEPVDPDDLEPVAIGDVASTAWETIDSDWATLEIEDDGEVYADEAGLGLLFVNLFENSLHGNVETTVVEIGLLPDGFYAADDGPPLDVEDRIRPAPDGTETPTTDGGLDLPIVRRIAGAHGWTVEQQESANGGAKVEIRDVDRR